VCDVPEKGYIKLHRKIWDNPIFCSGERFDRRSAWIYLLTRANYEKGSFVANGRIRHLQRGQMFTSIRHLSQIWRWDKTTVSRFLSDMETEKMITLNRTQSGTLITIINYSKYQDSGDRAQQNADTESDTESVSESDTGQTQNHPQLKKNIKKNYKKSKEETRGRRVIE
jgi:DNA-binding transcriptional regulator YhcF (GntR family)